MRTFTFAAAALLLSAPFAVAAPRISGEYLESRTCDVYTGPCFANGEMDLAGRKAVMAWKVDAGEWNGVSLDGLGAALVVRAERTLGEDDVFAMKPGRVRAVILVDESASREQQEALVAFVRDSAGPLAKEVVGVDRVPFVLENDHVASVGVLKLGNVAHVETRALAEGDCVCTNEIVFYNPLVDVQNAHPAYTKSFGFRGEGLGTKFETRATRSTFLATFRR
jgi:hypothetical protein